MSRRPAWTRSAAPVSFAAIALAWYLPFSARLLVQPPATAPGVTVGWYVIAAAGLTVTCAALRDQWHRYSRRLTRRRPGRCHRRRTAVA